MPRPLHVAAFEIFNGQIADHLEAARAGHAHAHGAIAQLCEYPVNRLGMAPSF
jgi:hypothetical protein